PQTRAATPPPPSDPEVTASPPVTPSGQSAISPPAFKKKVADTGTLPEDDQFPSVFIHVREDSPETLELVTELEKNGIKVSGVKKVNRGPRVVDLRYFHPREKQEANEIARRLKRFDIKIADVKYIKGYEETAKDRQYELWFPAQAFQ
ncbi:MAG: hypothetical protein ACREV2_08710, partial [Burkholderiales bacterium]